MRGGSPTNDGRYQPGTAQGPRFTVTAGTPDPDTVPSEGTTALTASFFDSGGHSVSGWTWSDGGAGGTFSDPTAQNPTYRAPVNHGRRGLRVSLTVWAACDGYPQLVDHDYAMLTVQPVAHALSVIMDPPSPDTVKPGETTSLSAWVMDSWGHGVSSWSWSDPDSWDGEPMGGTFSDPHAPSPTYAPPCLPVAAAGNRLFQLKVSVTCDGPSR